MKLVVAMSVFSVLSAALPAECKTSDEKCPREFSFLLPNPTESANPKTDLRTVHVEYESRALGKRARVNFTLPAGFPSRERRFPIALFLHGRGGQDVEQGYFSSIDGEKKLRELTANAQCPNSYIVISPYDDQKSYWREGPKSGPRLGTESWLTREIFAILKQCGRETVDLKTKPAIGGLSAGGNAALYYGEKYAKLFGQVYALSPVFRGDDDRALEPEDRAAFGRGAEFCEQDIVCRYEKFKGKFDPCPYPVRRFKTEIAQDDMFYAGTGGVAPEVSSRTRAFFNQLRHDCPENAEPPSLTGGHTVEFFKPGLSRMLKFFLRRFQTGSARFPPGRACALTKPETTQRRQTIRCGGGAAFDLSSLSDKRRPIYHCRRACQLAARTLRIAKCHRQTSP